MTTAAMRSGLQRRLLLLLLLPLGLFALVSIYFDYRTAGTVAFQKDQQLLRLIPLMADSVLPPIDKTAAAPLLLLAPGIEDFVKDRESFVGFRLSDAAGNFLAGQEWIAGVLPTSREPELHSIETDGTMFRIAAQRVNTAAGELIVLLADGSDPRQQWVRSIWVKVLLPNLALVLAAGLAVNWAVKRALKPLVELTSAVERRSPRDLSAIDAGAAPADVQPLVAALNRLLGLVSDQAEGQRRFVADAAHQLRTPLAGLQAQVEAWAQAAETAQSAQGNASSSGALSNSTSNSTVTSSPTSPSTSSPGSAVYSGGLLLSCDTIFKLRSAARRTSQLANQLLALSRADATAMTPLPMQQVDLKELCESVLSAHLDAAFEKEIDLGLDAAPVHALGHEWLLRELLSNLVDNAVKYTPRGGTVTIRCGQTAARADLDTGKPLHSAFFEVVDDGPGIALAERSKALERFYRVPGTAGEGNGLGLAIADELARAHQAELELADANMHAGTSARCGLRVRLTL